MKSIHIISWTLLGLALLSWAGLLWAASAIGSAASESVSSAESVQQQLDRLSYQKRLSALALDTQDERQKLEALSGADVVSIVNALEQSDATGKLGVKVNDAQAEGPSVTIPGGSLNALGFVVEASGTFQALMHQVSVFEHLPLPSQVEQVELERLTAGGAPWHLTVRVRVYTTAPISS